MDNITLDALSPQEDEFALLTLGVPSVYRAFWDPRRLPELAHWLNPAQWSADKPAGWRVKWLEFINGVAGENEGKLVLKSPNHSFRINAVAETFPKSTVVWLVRDPLETLYSNRKMWRAMFETYALWKWDPATLDEFLCTAFQRASDSLILATKLFPKERLIVVDFSQLTNAPLKTMEGVNRRLQIGNWPQIRPAIERFLNSKAGYRAENYPSREISSSLAKAITLFQSACQTATQSHGLL